MRMMTTSIPNEDAALVTQHRANIAASLARRLEAARASQNLPLIALLEQEQKQLELPADRKIDFANVMQQVKGLCREVWDVIANNADLSVEQIQDESGATWWHAYDAQSGKTIYAQSSAEVVKWIEDNQLGR